MAHDRLNSLDGVRILTFQFFVRGLEEIPSVFLDQDGELLEESPERTRLREERHAEGSGMQFLSNASQTEITTLIQDLAQEGWCLVWAFAEKRFTADSGRPYHTIRFSFAPHGSEIPAGEGVSEKADDYLAALGELADSAFWSIAGYRNSFWLAGKKVSGAAVIVLTGKERAPRLEKDGLPRMIWKTKDSWGKPVKEDGKIPLPARYTILIEGGSIQCERILP